MASWYERHIVPRLIRCACGCRALDEHRSQIVPQASGDVLEIGIGAGANLPFYDRSRINRISAIEPSDELRAIASAAAARSGISAELSAAVGEELPYENASFDSILCTYTLCSVLDVAQTLTEARRVLKPGGQFLFCEHGLAPNPRVARWQRRVEPFWKPLAGGCHLTRPVRGNIESYFRKIGRAHV